MSKEKIAIFDSGLGGLTVMREISALLPCESIVYFGDTKRLPYGTKPKETILEYSLENALFLLEKGIKALVIACHTSCAFALDALQSRFPVPVIGITTASIASLQQSKRPERIGILGTEGTIRSRIYEKELQPLFPQATFHFIPAPILVHLVEEGYIDHPMTHAAIQEYLRPLQAPPIDTLLLGCTHFPLLLKPIEHLLGKEVCIIDPAKKCAELLAEILRTNNLLNVSSSAPEIQFYVSSHPEKFQNLGSRFLSKPLGKVHVSQKKNPEPMT